MNIRSKQWNQGDLDRNPFAMKQQRASHEVLINAPVNLVFDHACVEGQPGWFPAGSIRLLFSETGRNEKYALWAENETGARIFRQPQLETFWTTTRFDPESHRFQAVMGNPGLTVGTLDVAMEDRGTHTLVRFDLSVSALGKAGSDLFGNKLGARMGHALRDFGETLVGSVASGSVVPAVQSSRASRRVGVTRSITITGDIDECFALACPVAELKWIDGWNFDLIYSESGTNETGCVFLEPSSGLSMLRLPDANTHWYTNRYDTEAHIFEAVWLTRDLTIGNFEARMTELDDHQVSVHWSLEFTGLGEAGNRLIEEAGLDERMGRGLGFLAASLKHYVETGRILRLSGHRKLKIAGALIGAVLGRHLRRQNARESRAFT